MSDDPLFPSISDFEDENYFNSPYLRNEQGIENPPRGESSLLSNSEENSFWDQTGRVFSQIDDNESEDAPTHSNNVSSFAWQGSGPTAFLPEGFVSFPDYATWATTNYCHPLQPGLLYELGTTEQASLADRQLNNPIGYATPEELALVPAPLIAVQQQQQQRPESWQVHNHLNQSIPPQQLYHNAPPSTAANLLHDSISSVTNSSSTSYVAPFTHERSHPEEETSKAPESDKQSTESRPRRRLPSAAPSEDATSNSSTSDYTPSESETRNEPSQLQTDHASHGKKTETKGVLTGNSDRNELGQDRSHSESDAADRLLAKHKRARSPSSEEPKLDRDRFLVECRNSGMSYKQIKAEGNFTEAESTLRGRFRTLTKSKDARVRKPEWTNKDLWLLEKAVLHEAKGGNPEIVKISWKDVAQYIYDNGGSYLFGNATCRKKWDELITGR